MYYGRGQPDHSTMVGGACLVTQRREFLVARNGLGRKQPKSPQSGGASGKDALPFLRAAAEWKGYVNVELGEGAAEQFRAFVGDTDLVREITAEVLLRGYKLSAVQVDNDETVRATAIAAFAGTVDAGYAVSAWGEDFYLAVASVVFIVGVHSRFDLSQWVREQETYRKRTF